MVSKNEKIKAIRSLNAQAQKSYILPFDTFYWWKQVTELTQIQEEVEGTRSLDEGLVRMHRRKRSYLWPSGRQTTIQCSAFSNQFLMKSYPFSQISTFFKYRALIIYFGLLELSITAWCHLLFFPFKTISCFVISKRSQTLRGERWYSVSL